MLWTIVSPEHEETGVSRSTTIVATITDSETAIDTTRLSLRVFIGNTVEVARDMGASAFLAPYTTSTIEEIDDGYQITLIRSSRYPASTRVAPWFRYEDPAEAEIGGDPS